MNYYNVVSSIVNENFSYEMVRVTENRLEPLGKERGLFSYLFDNVEFNFKRIIFYC